MTVRRDHADRHAFAQERHATSPDDDGCRAAIRWFGILDRPTVRDVPRCVDLGSPIGRAPHSRAADERLARTCPEIELTRRTHAPGSAVDARRSPSPSVTRSLRSASQSARRARRRRPGRPAGRIGERRDDPQHLGRGGLLLQRLDLRLASCAAPTPSNSRAFSIAMTAWSAKVSSSAICRRGERRSASPCDTRARRRAPPSPQQRHDGARRPVGHSRLSPPGDRKSDARPPSAMSEHGSPWPIQHALDQSADPRGWHGAPTDRRWSLLGIDARVISRLMLRYATIAR